MAVIPRTRHRIRRALQAVAAVVVLLVSGHDSAAVQVTPAALRQRAALRQTSVVQVRLAAVQPAGGLQELGEGSVTFAQDWERASVELAERLLELGIGAEGEWLCQDTGQQVRMWAAPPVVPPALASQARPEGQGVFSAGLPWLSSGSAQKATDAAELNFAFEGGVVQGLRISSTAREFDAVDLRFVVWRVSSDVAEQFAQGQCNAYVCELPPALKRGVQGMEAGEARRFWLPPGEALRQVRSRLVRPFPVALPSDSLVIDCCLDCIERDAVFFGPMKEGREAEREASMQTSTDFAGFRLLPSWMADFFASKEGRWVSGALNVLLYLAIAKMGLSRTDNVLDVGTGFS